MKNIFISLSTILSLLSFIIAGTLLISYFTDENLGMTLIFLVPALAAGILLALIPYFLNKNQKDGLGGFMNLLYKVDMVLLPIGIIALIYCFIN